MKKTVSIVLICLIIMAGVPKNYAWAEESWKLDSKSVVLLEASSGEVLYEKILQSGAYLPVSPNS